MPKFIENQYVVSKKDDNIYTVKEPSVEILGTKYVTLNETDGLYAPNDLLAVNSKEEMFYYAFTGLLLTALSAVAISAVVTLFLRFA